MTENLPVRYTRTDLDNAKTKGQLIGWVQAGAVIIGGALLLKAISWIWIPLLVGGAAFVGYKMISRKKTGGG